MSAVETEPVTTRYEGLIRTAQELFDTHEESGWRLANVIYDAVEELREQGFVNITGDGGGDPNSATRKVSVDLGRNRLGHRQVHRYFLVWQRYGSPAKRLDQLTFNDHLVMTQMAPPKSDHHSAAVTALMKMRADKREGRRSEYASAMATVRAAKGDATAGRRHENTAALSRARSSLRRVLDSNVWDYPDHQKVLDHLAEIQDLLDQVKAKPWSHDGGDS